MSIEETKVLTFNKFDDGCSTNTTLPTKCVSMILLNELYRGQSTRTQTQVFTIAIGKNITSFAETYGLGTVDDSSLMNLANQ